MSEFGLWLNGIGVGAIWAGVAVPGDQVEYLAAPGLALIAIGWFLQAKTNRRARGER